MTNIVTKTQLKTEAFKNLVDALRVTGRAWTFGLDGKTLYLAIEGDAANRASYGRRGPVRVAGAAVWILGAGHEVKAPTGTRIEDMRRRAVAAGDKGTEALCLIALDPNADLALRKSAIAGLIPDAPEVK